MKLANKQFSKSVQEEARKFETKILDLKGKRREEAMKAYLIVDFCYPQQINRFIS